MNYFAPLLKDGYKVYHPLAYNPITQGIYSNFTPRINTHNNTDLPFTVFVGLQYFIVEYLMNQWERTFFRLPKEIVVEEYSRVVDAMLGKQVDIQHIADLWELGYLPIRIKALP